MLKFIVFALLVAAIWYAFNYRPPGNRPPRDDRDDDDGGGPVPPTVHIGLDTSRKPANDAAPGDKTQPAMTEAGSDGGGGDGGGD